MLIISLFLGICIGSFLNVCIYRIPRKEDIVFTPSHCFNCGSKIKWYDLIPVISYIILKGKCRHCKENISIQYPIIELSNGAAYMGIYCIYGLSVEMVLYSALYSALLVISLIDYKHYIIPNGLVVFIGFLGIINLVFDYNNWMTYLIGFFAVSIFLFIIAVVTGGKMGGGDIKLMAVAGFLLGWQKIILALMIGSIVGAIIGLVLIRMKVIKREQQVPFGPFLAFGIMLAAILGSNIIQLYLGTIL